MARSRGLPREAKGCLVKPILQLLLVPIMIMSLFLTGVL